MNKLLKYGLLVMIILGLSSCAEEDNPVPSADDRDKLVGTWTCKETVTGGPITFFEVNFQKQGSIDTMVMKNFNNLGNTTSTLCVVIGNSITIPFQNVTLVSLQGSGTYSGGVVNMTYTADSDQISAQFNR
ncbi:MAG TPA: hypothetical protein PKH65_05445 [Bacteroidia bacterium]|nr:hypothetical protein [Bacteroidia bacterium]HNT80107.1 hypothetical protein [Bacteroidia bacterium]